MAIDPFTAISLGISAVGGAAKIVDGIINARAARKKLQELENAPLPLNAFEGLQVNTEQQDIVREELQRMAKDQSQMLQQAGTRAIIGGSGNLAEQLREGYRQLAADVGNKVDERNLLIAEEAANIERVREGRLMGQIRRQASQLAGSKQQAFSGLGDLGVTAAGIGGALGEQYAFNVGELTSSRNKTTTQNQDEKRDGNPYQGMMYGFI